ncbi:unnamed protein product [Discula destructiva]
MFNDFRRYRWMFHPAVLDSNELDDVILPLEQIIPLCSEEIIRNGTVDAASVSKVKFHHSCDKVYQANGNSKTTPYYILKTYHGDRHEQHYENEIQAFTIVQNYPPRENVVKCYATFRQGETLNLVMEYVPGGDLLQYFKEDRPPRTAEDIIHFWDSLTKMVKGLHYIHQVAVMGENQARYQLVHQDIKPDNILIKPRPELGFYQFSPVIADLGHCRTKYINSAAGPDPPAIDRRGNQIYCAPESIHHTSFRSRGPNYITPGADIFSAGAVLSDAAAWVAEGQAGREQYLRLRQIETNTIEGFANSGYEGAFHNGIERLACVNEIHRHIRSTLPPYDIITSSVLDTVEDFMMVPTHRLPASPLFEKFEMEIRKATEKLSRTTQPLEHFTPSKIRTPSTMSHRSIQEAQTPSTSDKPDEIWSTPGSATSTNGYLDDEDLSSPADAQSSRLISSTALELAQITAGVGSGLMLSSQSYLHKRPLTRPVAFSAPQRDTLRSNSDMAVQISMKDATEWRINKKERRPVDSRVDKDMKDLLQVLLGRDHFFFIDDTRSMKSHSLEMESTLSTLAYIAKHIDPNKLEMSFVSKPLEIFKRKHSTPLVEILREQVEKSSALEGAIETGLSKLVNKKIMRRLPKRFPGIGEVALGAKPITIFVFTDGRWGDDVRAGNGLDKSIGSLMRKITKRELTRTQVMFQFLRFGHDDNGRAHLQHLDDFGKQQDCDIVDYREFNGDVRAMFLAAFTEKNDKTNDSEPASGH